MDRVSAGVPANLDDLSYDNAVPYGDRGLADAVYMSGMSLTTVGHGDVVGPLQ